MFLFLFGLRRYVPVNNFSVISGRSHRFLGITSTFWEVNVTCSRIQHGDPSEFLVNVAAVVNIAAVAVISVVALANVVAVAIINDAPV